MLAQLIAIVVLGPFMLIFIFAGIHEYQRFKSEGRANYGLVYDEDTGTTHVTGIAEHEDAYDPDEFDPSGYNDRDVSSATDEDKA